MRNDGSDKGVCDDLGMNDLVVLVVGFGLNDWL